MWSMGFLFVLCVLSGFSFLHSKGELLIANLVALSGSVNEVHVSIINCLALLNKWLSGGWCIIALLKYDNYCI